MSSKTLSKPGNTLSSYAVITSDKHGTILSANQNATKMFGFSSGEFIGNKINILMPSPYAEQHDTYMKHYQTSKEPHVIGKSRVVKALHKNGDIMNLILSLSEAETARGTLYIALFEYAQDKSVIIDTDTRGKIYNVKGNVFLTLGYHKEELLGANISKIVPEPLSFQHDKFMERYLETGESKVIGQIRNLQAAHKTKKEPINISLCVNKAKLRIKRVTEEIEEIPGYRGIITPVDDVESMVTVSKTGLILSASEEFYLLFGYAEGEVLNKNISLLVKGDLREIFSKGNITNSPKNVVCLHKDNSIFTAEITIQPSIPSDEADSKIAENSWICKISRTTAKKKDKDAIDDGELMGLYEYGKILGSGFFGKVRMATHRITGERVAIKTLRKKQYLSVHMEYPPREIAVLKAIDHPHINRLYDTVVLDDRIHLVLEFVDGKELCEIVESKQLPEDICRHLWRQIISGISYLHENNIVHRDLKLENIIIDTNGNAKIIDLGFGNFILHENHLLRTFCGSPDYAAPELFLGKAYNGFRADCWSLGVLLYTMLSGCLPFGNSHDIMQGNFKFVDSIPPKARSLITSILKVNPEERLTIKDICAHSWTNIGYSELPPRFVSSRENLDEGILSEMVKLGMNVDTVKNSLRNQDHNQFTTTYFLMKKKQESLKDSSDSKEEVGSNSSDNDLKEGSKDASKDEKTSQESVRGEKPPKAKKSKKNPKKDDDQCSLL